MGNSCNLHCTHNMDLIWRGSTPTFFFNICLDTEIIDYEHTHIVFVSGPTLVDKQGNDIVVNEGQLACTLTQDETMSFKGSQVNIQILATTLNGEKPVSIIMTVPISSTLKGGDVW